MKEERTFKIFIYTYMPFNDEHEAICLIKTDDGGFEVWDAVDRPSSEFNDDTLFEFEMLKVFDDDNGHKLYEFYTSDGEISEIEKEYFKGLGVDYTVTKDENMPTRCWCTGKLVNFINWLTNK